ncbi:hypothetical protein NI385_27470 (plasmid) [Vibrio parahaemolyticus]|nr:MULTISPECIES: hypothetical protein [Vibrio]MDG2756991.1 hypothetical protein [Vibrio parahaemolyticus]MEA5357306.1 hypothetical protein [Vibrio parahaemolyticus]WMN81161.1 hypothetical protein NI385_27470 [Vibrio parahaemolyticus]HAT8520736.1 hypothetical protein [Vibrio vulnificus]HDY7671219.1 hypothetical protein [Vibrio vulnificus]
MAAKNRVKGMPLNPETHQKYPELTGLCKSLAISYNESIATQSPELVSQILIQEATILYRQERGGISSELAKKMSSIAIEEGKGNDYVSHDYYTPEFAERWSLSEQELGQFMDIMRCARQSTYATSESYMRIKADSEQDAKASTYSDNELTASGKFTMNLLKMTDSLKENGYSKEQIILLLHRMESII